MLLAKEAHHTRSTELFVSRLKNMLMQSIMYVKVNTETEMEMKTIRTFFTNFLPFLQKHFPSIILNPGEVYENKTTFKFSVVQG